MKFVAIYRSLQTSRIQAQKAMDKQNFTSPCAGHLSQFFMFGSCWGPRDDAEAVDSQSLVLFCKWIKLLLRLVVHVGPFRSPTQNYGASGGDVSADRLRRQRFQDLLRVATVVPLRFLEVQFLWKERWVGICMA